MYEQKMKNQDDPKDLQRIKKARQILYGDEIKEKILLKSKLAKTLDS